MNLNNILYFAYGSNMNRGQMHKRCPGSEFKCRAFLQDYEFVFDGYSKNWGGSVANIVQKNGNVVEGVIFKITKSDLGSLDRFEGEGSVYDRVELTVMDNEARNIQVYVYKRTGQKIGKPSESYRNTIIIGACECELSQGYIKKFLSAV